MRPAVFLDRDGVLNRTFVRDGVPHPPSCLHKVELLPGVAESLAKLAGRKIPLIVVTNQPDVARGTQTREAVEEINQFLRGKLPLTDIFNCFHDKTDNCTCRKPRDGLLQQAAQAYNIDLASSFMVGDRWSDIVAGQTAGCTTLLIEQSYSQLEKCSPDYRVADVTEAVQIILEELSRDSA